MRPLSELLEKSETVDMAEAHSLPEPLCAEVLDSGTMLSSSDMAQRGKNKRRTHTNTSFVCIYIGLINNMI